jgi:hypothetical protein
MRDSAPQAIGVLSDVGSALLSQGFRFLEAVSNWASATTSLAVVRQRFELFLLFLPL